MRGVCEQFGEQFSYRRKRSPIVEVFKVQQNLQLYYLLPGKMKSYDSQLQVPSRALEETSLKRFLNSLK